MKTIPKSLHTVTVLVAVACELTTDTDAARGQFNVDRALTVLGYADTPDTYELGNTARAILAKGAKS